MRRIYRKPYNPPQCAAKKRSKDNKASTPLVQPEWDDTIHDLTRLRASPEEVLKRKLSRTSHNQMGMTLLAQSRRSAQSGQQERYTPSASHDQDSSASDASDAESEDSYERSYQQQHLQQQQQEGEEEELGPAAQHVTAEQLHHHLSHQQQQQSRQRNQHTPASAPVLAQYDTSTADSDDDVCQWQSPIHPKPHQQQQQQQQQQRTVLQDVRNSARYNRGDRQGPAVGAVKHHKHSSWRPRQQQQQQEEEEQNQASPVQSAAGTVTVGADALQTLLDKIALMEEQLQSEAQQQQQQPESTSALQQQLAQSQQQLATTQQELSKLKQEHRQYVAHTSTLLTQLQTQVQQLLTNYNTLPPLPSLRPQQQQQQHMPSLQAYSSQLQPAAAAEAEAVADEHWYTAAGAGLRGNSSSSTDKLLQISEFIKKQLQEQEAAAQSLGGTAATAGAASNTAVGVSGSLWPNPAAAAAAGLAGRYSGSSEATTRQPGAAAAAAAATAGIGSPSRSAAAAAGRAAGSVATTGSACSSPTRKKSDTRFTPAAVADTVTLPSYAAMRQQGRASVTSHAAVPGSAGDSLQHDCNTGLRSSGAAAGSLRVAPAAAAGFHGSTRSSWEGVVNSAGSSNGSNPRDQAHVGSPQRLLTTQVPQSLPARGLGGTNSAFQQQQQQRGFTPSSIMQTGRVAPSQPQLSVKAPTAHAAAVPPHVWEAELSSPRPQQMQVPAEHMHYHLSNAAAESIGQGQAASVGQLPGDLAALLRDLGLASLELTAGGTQSGDGLLLPAAELGTSSETKGASSSAVLPLGDSGDVRAASGRSGGVPVVVSEAATAPAAATAGGMLSNSRGDGVLTGLEDVDWGLQEGLPMAAVGRVYTAAGFLSDRGEVLDTGPRVFKEGLKGNMCFRDHLRAAAAAAAASGAKGGIGS